MSRKMIDSHAKDDVEEFPSWREGTRRDLFTSSFGSVTPHRGRTLVKKSSLKASHSPARTSPTRRGSDSLQFLTKEDKEEEDKLKRSVAIVQQADLIEARIDIMEQASGQGGGEDPLDEQRFCEECQLVIAKHAFPNQTGSKGSTAWKDILWVPKCATGITAMMNRRMRGMQMMMEKAIAADFRSKITQELDQLRSMAIVHEEEAKTAVLVKEKYMKELENKEMELSRFRAELADQFNNLVHIKTETEESRAELKRQRSIAEESVKQKELAEATIQELTVALTQLRQRNQSLEARVEGLEEEARTANARDTASQELLLNNRTAHEQERKELGKAFQESRSVLERECQEQVENVERERRIQELRIAALERDMEEVQGLELALTKTEKRCLELEDELEASRDHIIEMVKATAKIGHFSMRTGGGYQSIGQSWAAFHQYVAGTWWGQAAGVTPLIQEHARKLAVYGSRSSSNLNTPRSRSSRSPRLRKTPGLDFFEAALNSKTPEATPRGVRTPRSISGTPRQQFSSDFAYTPRSMSARTPPPSARSAGNAQTPRSALRGGVHVQGVERAWSEHPGHVDYRGGGGVHRSASQRLQDSAENLRLTGDTTPRKRGRRLTSKYAKREQVRGGGDENSEQADGRGRKTLTLSGAGPTSSKLEAERAWAGLISDGKTRVAAQRSREDNDVGRENSNADGRWSWEEWAEDASSQEHSENEDGEGWRAWSSEMEGKASGIKDGVRPAERSRKGAFEDREWNVRRSPKRASFSVLTEPLDCNALLQSMNEIWAEVACGGNDEIEKTALPLILKRLAPSVPDRTILECCADIIAEGFSNREGELVRKSDFLAGILNPQIRMRLQGNGCGSGLRHV